MSERPRTKHELVDALDVDHEQEEPIEAVDVALLIADAFELMGLLAGDGATTPVLHHDWKPLPGMSIRRCERCGGIEASCGADDAICIPSKSGPLTPAPAPPPTEPRREAWGEAEAKRLYNTSPSKIGWDNIGERARSAWLAVAAEAARIEAEHVTAKDAEIARLTRERDAARNGLQSARDVITDRDAAIGRLSNTVLALNNAEVHCEHEHGQSPAPSLDEAAFRAIQAYGSTRREWFFHVNQEPVRARWRRVVQACQMGEAMPEIDRERLGRIGYEAVLKARPVPVGFVEADYDWSNIAEPTREGYRIMAEAIARAAQRESEA